MIFGKVEEDDRVHADLAKKTNPVLPESRPMRRIKVDVVFHRVRAENTERWIQLRDGVSRFLEVHYQQP